VASLNFSPDGYEPRSVDRHDIKAQFGGLMGGDFARCMWVAETGLRWRFQRLMMDATKSLTV